MLQERWQIDLSLCPSVVTTSGCSLPFHTISPGIVDCSSTQATLVFYVTGGTESAVSPKRRAVSFVEPRVCPDLDTGCLWAGSFSVPDSWRISWGSTAISLISYVLPQASLTPNKWHVLERQAYASPEKELKFLIEK